MNVARSESKKQRRHNAIMRYKQRMIANPSPLETTLYNTLFELKIPYEPQWIIGDRYIVDACILGNGIKKVIEADGFYHEGFKQRRDDAKRDKGLKHLGFTVLHLRRHEFYNTDLLKQRITDFVFDTDAMALPDQRRPDSETLDERFEGQHIQGYSGPSKDVA